MRFNEDVLSATKSGGASSEHYLKLKDKETVAGIFCGEISEFYQSWPPGGAKVRKTEPFPGGKFRFEVNFVVKDGTGYTPKVFEGGLRVYRQLAALHQEYNLKETVFKITRNGTEKNTTYTFMPAKQSPSRETLEYVHSMELIPLGGGSAAPATEEKSDDEVPF